jgi:hypothetical protein
LPAGPRSRAWHATGARQWEGPGGNAPLDRSLGTIRDPRPRPVRGRAPSGVAATGAMASSDGKQAAEAEPLELMLFQVVKCHRGA